MKRTDAERLINDWLDTADEVTGATVIDFITTVIGMHPPLIPVRKSSRDLTQIQPTHVFEWEDEV